MSIMSCVPPGFPPINTSALQLLIQNSPERTTPDYVQNLLQEVTFADNPICSKCLQGKIASSRCHSCSEILCDSCILQHQNDKSAKDHRIVRFASAPSSTASSTSQVTPSSTVSSSSQVRLSNPFSSSSQIRTSSTSSSSSQASSPRGFLKDTRFCSGSSSSQVRPSSTTSSSSQGSSPPGFFTNPRFGPTSSSSQVIRASSTASSSSQASSPPAFLTNTRFCTQHQKPVTFYCETCLALLCHEDCLIKHRNHKRIHIQNIRTNAFKLSQKTSNTIAAVREAITIVQTRCENVENCSYKAVSDVKNVMKRFTQVIQLRERELLKTIELQRLTKGKTLHTLLRTLKCALINLNQTSDVLNDSLELGSCMDLVMANDRAASELMQLDSVCKDEIISPREEDKIIFFPPSPLLSHALKFMGNIDMKPTNSPGTVAPLELRAIESTNLIPRQVPGSCCIYGTMSPVVAHDNGANDSIIFGMDGEEDGQLCRPWGVCCDKDGHIIIADRSNNRVQIFNPDGSFARKFGSLGATPGKFNRPAGVAMDPNNRIVVADKDNHRIQIFTLQGTYQYMFGEKGCRNGQFNYPWDVAVNSSGKIVVSDTRNHRIQLFTNEGHFINKYGFESSVAMWKHFDSPRGVCFTPNGNIVVTDFNNHRLIFIDSNLSFAQYFGSEGSGFKQFMRPQGVVCDDEGRIIVADSRNNRIQVFELNGTFLWRVGIAGKGRGEFDIPTGICINPEGRIVVVDFGNNRVHIL